MNIKKDVVIGHKYIHKLIHYAYVFFFTDVTVHEMSCIQMINKLRKITVTPNDRCGVAD